MKCSSEKILSQPGEVFWNLCYTRKTSSRHDLQMKEMWLLCPCHSITGKEAWPLCLSHRVRDMAIVSVSHRPVLQWRRCGHCVCDTVSLGQEVWPLCLYHSVTGKRGMAIVPVSWCHCERRRGQCRLCWCYSVGGMAIDLGKKNPVSIRNHWCCFVRKRNLCIRKLSHLSWVCTVCSIFLSWPFINAALGHTDSQQHRANCTALQLCWWLLRLICKKKKKVLQTFSDIKTQLFSIPETL